MANARPKRKPTAEIQGVYAESCLRNTDDKMLEHHWHPYFELFYIENGSCRMMVENELYDLHTGDFVLIPPHTFHFTRYLFGPCRRGAVFFREGDVRAEIRGLLPGKEQFFQRTCILQTPAVSQVQVDALLHRMVLEDQMSDERSGLMLDAMLSELLLLCGRVCTVLEMPARIHTTDNEIVRAARFITEHFAEPITAAQIAAAAGFSPNYLSRKFREAAGFGVHEYLMFVRLRYAAQRLVASRDSITEISFQSGFSDSNYFKDAFKKRYGCTPREYRQKKEQS